MFVNGLSPLTKISINLVFYFGEGYWLKAVDIICIKFKCDDFTAARTLVVRVHLAIYVLSPTKAPAFNMAMVTSLGSFFLVR